jgi:hypothetical protein
MGKTKSFREEKNGFVVVICQREFSRLEFMRRTWEDSICYRKTLDTT